MASLTECLEMDHRRLDELLAECKELAALGAFADAIERFEVFARGLWRHIDAEERVLFPALEAHTPQAMPPIKVLLAEHGRLREELVALEQALGARDPSWRAAFHELVETLRAHNGKEERVLYPMADWAARTLPDLGALSARLLEALEEAE
jgi:iron-sulfur cluster repair protein YtfE (RIC family)